MGVYIPDITVGMLRKAPLEAVEALLAEGEMHDVELPNWVPCSERLPEGPEIVLLTLPEHTDRDGNEYFSEVICGHYIGGKDHEWGISDGHTFGFGLVSARYSTNPIAWMPKPKPWKGAERETD